MPSKERKTSHRPVCDSCYERHAKFVGYCQDERMVFCAECYEYEFGNDFEREEVK